MEDMNWMVRRMISNKSASESVVSKSWSSVSGMLVMDEVLEFVMSQFG
jgi:hypothetical protein